MDSAAAGPAAAGPAAAAASVGSGASTASAATAAPTPEETELLHAVVAQPSFSGEEEAVARLLAGRLAAAKWAAGVDDTGNLVAEKGSGGRTLLFLGHIDTVRGWFPVALKDGCLWGRGSVDAKGPLAAFIAGAERAFAERDKAGPGSGSGQLPLHLVVVGAVGEEADSRGALAIVDRYRPDFCVIGEPSGWEGLTLGYKGSTLVDVTVSAAHGHGAGRGQTAVEAAMEFWRLVDEGVRGAHQPAPAAAEGPAAGSFEQLTCSITRIGSHSDGLADQVTLSLDFRLPPGAGEEHINQVLGAAAASLPAAGVEWRIGQLLPAYRAAKNNALVRQFMFAVRAAGGRPRFKLKSGTSDMNIVAPVWNCPVLAYGPGDSSLDHTPEERLSLEEYGRAINVWQQVLESLASL